MPAPFSHCSIETYAELELYWHIFPPRLAHHTIALVGATNAVGAQGPMYELQARLAGRVFKGLVELPCQEMMLEDVARRKNIFKKIYGHPKIHVSIPEVWYIQRVISSLVYHRVV